MLDTEGRYRDDRGGMRFREERRVPIWRRYRRRAAILSPWVASLLLSSALGFAAYRLAIDNLAEVVPGELYRSSQIDREGLAAITERYHIRSVLNLRGAQRKKDWYQEEIAASQDLGLMHVDFPMKASEALSEGEVEKLVALMRTMPKPILVHCRQGADRTGLASALYLAALKGAGGAEAGGQLSLYFGHVAVPLLSEGWPMSETWERTQLARVEFSAP